MSLILGSTAQPLNLVEFGTFDPMLASFIPITLMGSHDGTCVTGFEQAAYIAGVSSNLWNEFNITVRPTKSVRASSRSLFENDFLT